jgi:FKBP-type peptidyl-prolyl cis-trans isomerase SlyD
MQVHAPCVVSLTWKLTDAQGREIDTLAEPTEFLVGGQDLLAKIDEALEGLEADDVVELHLEPAHAFGEYRAGLVCFEDRSLFPEHLEPGMAFEGLPAGHRTPDMPADVIYHVTEVYDDHVVLDGNHPLAGIAVAIRIRIAGVREATDEEVASGTVATGGSPMLAGLAVAGRASLH